MCHCADGFKDLEKIECTPDCGVGRYGNSATQACEDCSSSCKDCVDTAIKCISCKDNMVLNDNECLPSCPGGRYVDENNVC